MDAEAEAPAPAADEPPAGLIRTTDLRAVMNSVRRRPAHALSCAADAASSTVAARLEPTRARAQPPPRIRSLICAGSGLDAVQAAMVGIAATGAAVGAALLVRAHTRIEPMPASLPRFDAADDGSSRALSC